MSTNNGKKFVLFQYRKDILSGVKTIRLRKDQVEWLENSWDKETFGEFAPFLRQLLDAISSKKIDIEKLAIEIGFNQIEVK